MRFYTQLHAHISKRAPLMAPKAVREQLEAVLTVVVPALGGLLRSTVQHAGARVVDRAIDVLGLGRHGIRLTGSSLSNSATRWEAELSTWSAASVAEAAELLIHRALVPFFDLEGGEYAALESMKTKWLQSARGSQTRGSIVLEWSVNDREMFRRRVLENLANGTTAELTLAGVDESGIVIVEVEATVFARARAQLKGSL
ncbi:MAG: hypothetical protein U1E10_04015 [Bdellovibrionales bacterium]|nr:hypothetical protein [Bdellovibrionales bacterium]